MHNENIDKNLINITDTKLDNSIINYSEINLDELPDIIANLEIKMKSLAKELDFENAAKLRDKIKKLRQKLIGHS